MELNELENVDPNEIRIMIERGEFNHLDQIGWLDLCTLLMKKYKKIEKYGLFQLIQKETLVYSSEIRNSDHKLIPISGTDFNFNEEDLNYFISKVSNTRNPLLKAKFSNIVWQETKEKNTEYAYKAAEGYLEMADFYFENEDYHYLTKILFHSLHLSIISTNKEILEKCVSRLVEMIENLGNLNKIRYTYDLLKGLIDNYGLCKDLIDKEEILNAIRKGKEHYNNVDYTWQNRFVELERKIWEN